MWEYSISFYDNKKAIHFKNKVSEYIKKNNGVTTILCENEITKVLIGAPIVERFNIHNYIKEKIAENILLYYKTDFILSKLNFKVNNTTDMQVFLKALLVFDSDVDKEIILTRLNFDDSLIIESFIDFKLNFLKDKWKELVSLANDNSMYILSEESFIELIKFLISNLDYRIKEVNVFSKNDCYLICDENGNKINDFLIEKCLIYDDNNLLTTLIAINPKKIKLHCNTFIKDKLIQILYLFFDKRIEICK